MSNLGILFSIYNIMNCKYCKTKIRPIKNDPNPDRCYHKKCEKLVADDLRELCVTIEIYLNGEK